MSKAKNEKRKAMIDAAGRAGGGPRRPGPARRLFALSFSLFALPLPACENPLGLSPLDYGRHPSTERLRRVEPLDKERYAAPAEPVKVPSAGERYTSRFVGLPEVALRLEDARAAVLENNLDLRVALVDPTIRAEGLREQEAKFEAVFRPSASYRAVNQPTLDVTAANEQKRLDLGAGVDVPLLSGGRASVDFLSGKQDQNSAFFALPSAYDSNVRFSLSQPLLRGAGRRAQTYSIRIAAYDLDVSEARTTLETVRQVAAADRAYWRLYAVRRALGVRQQQYEVARAQLERARRRVEAGTAPPLEITRAEAGAASQLEQIILAEKAVLDQQREVKRLLNIPGLGVGTATQLLAATDPDPVRYVFDGAALARDAVANRMEMLELELRLAQDYATIEFEKNRALPLLVLDFAYGVPGLGATWQRSLDQLDDANFQSWRVGLSGEIPLGNEAARARVQQAILTRLQRLGTREARRLAIEQEVYGAVDALEAAWQRILAARQSVILAARTLEGERRQFEAGVRTSTEVLDAAARLADEQTSEVRALADYQIALVDVAFATGTLLGASKVEWAPADPRAGAPGKGDPTPYAWPWYDDPERVKGPADR